MAASKTGRFIAATSIFLTLFLSQPKIPKNFSFSSLPPAVSYAQPKIITDSDNKNIQCVIKPNNILKFTYTNGELKTEKEIELPVLNKIFFVGCYTKQVTIVFQNGVALLPGYYELIYKDSAPLVIFPESAEKIDWQNAKIEKKGNHIFYFKTDKNQHGGFVYGNYCFFGNMGVKRFVRVYNHNKNGPTLVVWENKKDKYIWTYLLNEDCCQVNRDDVTVSDISAEAQEPLINEINNLCK